MQQDPQQLQDLQCELCTGKQSAVSPADAAIWKAPQAATSRAGGGRKLKILCLHGFRQDARLMHDSLSTFQKEVADIAQLEFAEAPHTLPCLYRPKPEQGSTSLLG